MRRFGGLWVIAIVFILAVTQLSAQRTKTSRGNRGTSGSRTYTAPPPPSTSTTSSSRSSTSSRGYIPMGGRTTSSFTRYHAPQAPKNQTYSPGLKMSYGHWLSTWDMLRYLSMQYRFLNIYNSAWRYSQGDSPLTQEMIEIGLLKPVSASSSILATCEDLTKLIDAYEDGRIDRTRFHQLVKVRTKAIRSFAKTIRNDVFLDYLDQTDNKAEVEADKARSIAELRMLCGKLRGFAAQIDTGLSAFYESDMSRLVAVDALKRPSFDSLSKGIDRLAKSIEKSAKRL